VKTGFKDSFAKDLQAVRETILLKRVREIIEAIERRDSLADLPNLKKLKTVRTISNKSW
jgi:hypothetical protein